MASNSGTNNSISNYLNDDTPPIRLHKTTNITKIKGWRNKKFNLETADNEINGNCGSESAPSKYAEGSMLYLVTEKSNSDSTEKLSLTADNRSFLKMNRNSALLDSLVKKIGDTIECGYESDDISYLKENNFRLDFAVENETMKSSLCETNNSIRDMSVDNSVNSMETSAGTEKCSSFVRSAFVSESLDNFLSKEPAFLKLNNVLRSSPLEVLKLRQTKIEVTPSVKLVQGKLKRSSPSGVDGLLDRHGSKPKTLAEKRRILENSEYCIERTKQSENDDEKKSNNRANNFRRLCKIKRIKRILRSNINLLSDESIAEIKCNATNQDLNNDNLMEVKTKYDNVDRVVGNIVNLNVSDNRIATKERKYDNIDRVLDSVINNTDSVSSEREFGICSAKEQAIRRKLWKLRHPHISSYRINKHIRHRRLNFHASRNIVKEKLQNINKIFQSKNALKKAVYIKPLRNRIPYDFMAVLTDEDIVKLDSEVDLSKKIGMVLFLGIGRCIYQEQLENLESMRKETCIIDENFAKFATSTVLDRKNPRKICRVLMPVVSTKLLTFMHRYSVIRSRYQHFLIDRFKIKIPPPTITKVTSIESNGKNDNGINYNISSDAMTTKWRPLEQNVRHNFKTGATSVNRISNGIPNKNDNTSKSSFLSDNNKVIPLKRITESSDLLRSDKEAIGEKLDIKFKKRVIKKGRIFHEDKKIKKLSYELRRLNHAFVEIDNDDDSLNTRTICDVPDVLLPDDVLPNKLAKVESEFHQTIMKSNKEFVFVSTSGERSQRQRKLPKKLKDAVLSNEYTYTMKEQANKLKANTDYSNMSDSTVSVKTRPQIAAKEGLSSRDVQSPEFAECLDSPSLELDPSDPGENSFSNQPKAGLLENGVIDNREKETVIVQTSKSILKKNISCNMINSTKTSSDSGSRTSLNKLFDISDHNITSDINNTKLKIDYKKYPVLRLHKVKHPLSTRIYCMDHNLYNCICVCNKHSFQLDADGEKRPSQLVAEGDKHTSLLNAGGSIYPQLDADVDKHPSELNVDSDKDPSQLNTDDDKHPSQLNTDDDKHPSQLNTDDDKHPSQLDGGGDGENLEEAISTMCPSKLSSQAIIDDISKKVEGAMLSEPNNGDSMVVPRIEKVMTLRLEDFFKDDISNVVSTSRNVPSAVSKGSSSKNDDFLQPSSKLLSKLLDSSNKCDKVPGHLKRPRVATPVRNFNKCEFRFFCVRFTYSFSYIKFFGGVNFNDIPELKDQVSNNSPGDSNVGVILAYTGMVNMIRESYSKNQCVFQRLVKGNYNYTKFNYLPFGVYAVCRNMILFGPYETNETHNLQAFRVVHKEPKSKNVSEVKQIPFVKPEFMKEYGGIDFAEGYWWYVTDNQLSKDRVLIDLIYTKRIPPTIRETLYLVPITLAQITLPPNSTKIQPVSNQGYVSGVINADIQNIKSSIKDTSCAVEQNSTTVALSINDKIDKCTMAPDFNDDVIIIEDSEPNDNFDKNSLQKECINVISNQESAASPIESFQSDATLNSGEQDNTIVTPSVNNKLDKATIMSDLNDDVVVIEDSELNCNLDENRLQKKCINNQESAVSPIESSQTTATLNPVEKDNITSAPSVNNELDKGTNMSDLNDDVVLIEDGELNGNLDENHLQKKCTNGINNQESTLSPIKPTQSILNSDNSPVIPLDPSEKSVVDKTKEVVNKKYTYSYLQNNQIMSVICLEEKDEILALAGKNLNDPEVRQLINEKCQRGVDFSVNEPVVLSVQPNGDVYPIVLCKLENIGYNNIQWEYIGTYCLKDNNRHIIRINNGAKNPDRVLTKRKQLGTLVVTCVARENNLQNGKTYSAKIKDSQAVTNDTGASSGGDEQMNVTLNRNLLVPQSNDQTIIHTNVCNGERVITPEHNDTEPSLASVIEFASELSDATLIETFVPPKNSQPIICAKTSQDSNLNKDRMELGDVLNLESITAKLSANKSCNKMNSDPLKLVSPAVDTILPTDRDSCLPMTTNIGKAVGQSELTKSSSGSVSEKIDCLDASQSDLPSNDSLGSVPITSSELSPKINFIELLDKSQAIKHSRKRKEPSSSTVKTIAGCLVASTEAQPNNNPAIDNIQSLTRFTKSAYPKGVLLKVTVKSDSNIFQFKSSSGRLNSDLSMLVTALNSRVIKRKPEPMSDAMPSRSLNSNISGDQVVLSYNDGSSSKATCSFVKSPSPRTLASNLEHTPIVWNSLTQCFNVNELSTDQIPEEIPAVAVSQESNSSVGPGTIDIDNTTENITVVSGTSFCDQLTSIDSDDNQENIESGSPQLNSLSNIAAVDSDPMMMVQNSVPSDISNENELSMIITSVRSLRTEDPAASEIFNEDDFSIPFTSESIECTESDFVNEDNGSLSSPTVFANELHSPLTLSVLPSEEVAAATEMGATSDDNNDVRVISETAGQFPKFPLLKQTMMNLLEEAKLASSELCDIPDVNNPIEDLELVSSNDTLPNFLESYGIHFTDEDL